MELQHEAEIITRETLPNQGGTMLNVRCGNHEYALLVKPDMREGNGFPYAHTPIIAGRAFKHPEDALAAGMAAIERIVNNAPERAPGSPIHVRRRDGRH